MLIRDTKDALQRLSSLVSQSSHQRRARLHTSDFTIISNDCWGAEVYKDMNLPFGTPLIGTIVAGPCFMRLVRDCSRILRSDIEFIAESRYEYIRELKEHGGYFPTGTLDEGRVEVQFLHYKTTEEARFKWNKRAKRILDDRLFFKMSGDKDEFKDEDYVTFDALPLEHKLALSKEAHPELTSVVQVSDWTKDGKLMYARSLQHFNIVDWLNGVITENVV